MNLKSVLLAGLIIGMNSLSVHAAGQANVQYDNTRSLTFVRTMDDLNNNYKGCKGLYCVRLASREDDTVKNGWAVYFWNAPTESWKIAFKQDTIDTDLDAMITELKSYINTTYATKAQLDDYTPTWYTTSQFEEQQITNQMLVAAIDNGKKDAHESRNIIITDSNEITNHTYCVNNLVLSKYVTDELVIHQDQLGTSYLYIENIERNREALPVTFNSSDGSMLGDSGSYKKLPLLVTLTQPYEGRGIIAIKELNDGYSWNPTITNTSFTVTSSDDSFEITTDDDNGYVYGTELQLLDEEAYISLSYTNGTVNLPLYRLTSRYDAIKVDDWSFSTNATPYVVKVFCTGNDFTKSFIIKQFK